MGRRKTRAKRENLPQKCLLYTVRWEFFFCFLLGGWCGFAKIRCEKRVWDGRDSFNTRRNHMNRFFRSTIIASKHVCGVFREHVPATALRIGFGWGSSSNVEGNNSGSVQENKAPRVLAVKWRSSPRSSTRRRWTRLPLYDGKKDTASGIICQPFCSMYRLYPMPQSIGYSSKFRGVAWRNCRGEIYI